MSVKGKKCHRLDGETQQRVIKNARRKSVENCPYAQTNAQFAAENDTFKQACATAGVEPTKRQASKFRRGMGQAWRAK